MHSTPPIPQKTTFGARLHVGPEGTVRQILTEPETGRAAAAIPLGMYDMGPSPVGSLAVYRAGEPDCYLVELKTASPDFGPVLRAAADLMWAIAAQAEEQQS